MSAELDLTAVESAREGWQSIDPVINRSRSVAGALEEVSRTLARRDRPAEADLDRVRDALDRLGGDEERREALSFLTLAQGEETETPIASFRGGEPSIPADADAVAAALADVAAGDDWSGVESRVEDVLSGAVDDPEDAHPSVLSLAELFETVADAAVYARDAHRDEFRASLADAYDEAADVETGPVDPLTGLEDQPIALFPVDLETRFYPTDETKSPEEFWVRVYPDAIHEDNHEAELTEREVKHGRRFWARMWLAAHAQTPTDSVGSTALDAYAELGVDDPDAAADYFQAGLDPDRLGWYLDVAADAGAELAASDAERFHLADLAPDEVAHYIDAGAELDAVLELALGGLSPSALDRYADRWVLADDALEYHLHALSPSAVERYLAFDVAPPDALEYHRQGLTPSLLEGYRSVGVDLDDAPTFYRAAIRPETVSDLAGVGIDVEAIGRYLEAGVPPVLVGHYVAEGADPETVVDAIESSSPPYEGLPAVALGTQLAQLQEEFAERGFGPSDGYDMADVYSFHRHGLSPAKLEAYLAVEVEPERALGYAQHGLDPDAVSAYHTETNGAVGPELALGCWLAELSPDRLGSYVDEAVAVTTAYGLHHAEIGPDGVAAYREAGVEPEQAVGFDRVGATVDELDRYAEAGLSARETFRYSRGGYEPTELVLDPEGGYLHGEPPRVGDGELRELIAGVDISRFSSAPADRHEQLRDRAWGRLVDRVGERRAGYVVHALEPTDLDGEPIVDELLTPPSDATPPPLRFPERDRRPSTWSKQTQIRLLPDRWAVVCEWEDGTTNDGEPPTRRRVVYGEPIPDPLPAGPSWTGDIDDDGPTLEEWIVDFDVAVDAGMGVRIDLSEDAFPGWTPSDGFRRVYVVGVKASMDPQETAAELVDLLDAHGATDGFEFLENGTQTNVDSPEPTGALDEEPTPVLPPRVTARNGDDDQAAEYRGDGDLLARALGLDTESRHPFAYVPGADATDQLDARHAHSALWPATLGYTLTHVLAPNALAGNPTLDEPAGEPPILGVGELSPDLLSGPLAVHDALREHFVRYVRGGGPLPPVRVGDQPYGVLPVKPTSDPETAIAVLDPHVEEAITTKRLTVPEAKEAGASTDALVESELTTEQLVEAEADPVELHDHGVEATELVESGVDASALRELDASIEELSEAGASLPDLVSAGFEVVELERIGATIGDVAEAGGDPRQLARAGATVAELAGYDLPVEEAIQAGFAARDLLEAGFTAADVLTGGAPPSALSDVALDSAALDALDAPAGTLKQAGVPADRLVESGYSARELLNGGYRETELGETGISLGDVEDAGRTAADAAADGITVEGLRDHGYAAADLLADEYDVTGLFEAGYTTGELLDAGADVDELIDAGASVGALRAAGIDLERLSSAGADPAQLREAGVAAAELADLPAEELAEAGYAAAELADLEYAPEELIEAGYAPAELRDVGIDPSALADVVDERAESLAADLFGGVGERSPTERIRTVERRVDRVERELYSFGFDPATVPASRGARESTRDLEDVRDRLEDAEGDLRSDGGEGSDEEEDDSLDLSDVETSFDESETIETSLEDHQDVVDDHGAAEKATTFDEAAVDDVEQHHDVELTENAGESSGSGAVDQPLVAADDVIEVRDIVYDDVDVDGLVERLVTGLQPYWSDAADQLPYSDVSDGYGEESVLDALSHQAISQGGSIDAEVSQPAQLWTTPPSQGHVSRFDLPDDHERWPALDALLEAAEFDSLDPRLSNTSITDWEFATPTIATEGMADEEIGAFLEHLASVPSRPALSVTDLANYSFHDAQLPPFDVEALDDAGLSLEITEDDDGYPLARKNGPIESAEETSEYWDAMPRSWQAATVVALIEEIASSNLDGAMSLVHDVIDEAATPAQRSFERSLEVAAKNAAREGEAMVPNSLARVLFQHAVSCEFAAARLRLGVRYDELPAQGPDYSILTANAGLAGPSLGGQATTDLWEEELETDVVVDLYDDLVGVDDDWSETETEHYASQWIHRGFRAHHGRGSRGSTDHQPLTYEWPLARAMAGTPWAVPIDDRMTEFGDSLAHLASCEPEEIATLTAETLDCCSHRLDAWWTSMATKRLYELRESQYEETAEPGCYVGGYGFVENCKPTPEDEPEFVHAPSVQQASTAAYLRGGYLAGEERDTAWAPETDEDGTELPTEAGNPLEIDLSPERVHDARWLLDAVGKGHSLSELLGYEFERRMHEETLDPDGENLLRYRRALREVFPGIRDSLAHADESSDSDQSSDSAEGTYAQVGGEFADSDVLDGYALCKRWETSEEYDDWHRLPFGEPMPIDDGDEAPTPAFDGDEHDALTAIVDELRDDLDAVSDLLVSEGVHQLGKERPGAAGAALDALTAGSSFRDATVTETKPPETGLAHRLFVLLEPQLLPAEPVVPSPVTPSFAAADTAAGVTEPIAESVPSLRATAEPTLESWTRSLLPALDDVGFAVREADAPADAETETVRLSALSIGALDLVALATDVEGRGLTELDRRLAYVLRRTPPAHVEDLASDDVELELTDAGEASVSVAAAIETARSLGTVIDGAEPAAADDLAHPEQIAHSGYTASIDDADRVRVSGGDERAPPASRATVEELAKRADRIDDQLRTIADRLASWFEETDDGDVTDRVDDAVAAIEDVHADGLLSALPAALDALEGADLDAECGALAAAIPPGPPDAPEVDGAIVLEAAPDQPVSGTVGHCQTMPDESALSSATLPWEATPSVVKSDAETPSTVDVVISGLAGATPIVREATGAPVDDDGQFEATIDATDIAPGTALSVVAVDDGSIVFAASGRVVGDASELTVADKPGLAALCWLVAAFERLDPAGDDASLAALGDALDAIDPDGLAAALGAFAPDRWDGPGTVDNTTVTDADVEAAAALATLADVDPTSMLTLLDPVRELATAIGLPTGVDLTGIDGGHEAVTPYLAADGLGVESVETADGVETEIPLGRSALRARLERIDSDGWHAASDGEIPAGRVAGFDPVAAGVVADADEPAVLAATLDALARAPPWLAVALEDDGVTGAHATLSAVADWSYAASELGADAVADAATAFDELAGREPVEDYLDSLLGDINVSVAADGLEWLAESNASGDDPVGGESVAGLVDERLTAPPDDASPDDDTAMAAVDSFVEHLESADGASTAVRRAVCERVREPLLAASIAGIDGAAPRVAVGATERDERALRTQADIVHGAIRDRLTEAAEYETVSGRYETVDRQVARERSRIDALVDGDVPVLAPFAPANATQLTETFASLNGLGDAPEPDDPHQGETWLQRLAQVRERPADLREALSYAESLTGDWHRDLLVGQLPVGDDEWVGAEGVVPDRGSLSLVAQFGPQAEGDLDPAGDLGWMAGLAVDTWVESVPHEEVSTGVAVRYDEPGTEPPQSVLLSVPREDDDWSLETVVGSVSESMCYARHRSVDLGDLADLGEIDVDLDDDGIQPELARTLVPGLYFPQGDDNDDTLAVNLDSFEVYDSIEDLVSLEFEGQPITMTATVEKYDLHTQEVTLSDQQTYTATTTKKEIDDEEEDDSVAYTATATKKEVDDEEEDDSVAYTATATTKKEVDDDQEDDSVTYTATATKKEVGDDDEEEGDQ